MSWITKHIQWIMLIAGVCTASMVMAVFAPQSSLQQFFGASLSGPLANTIVQSWAALITLIGVMLIIAAFKPHLRVFTAIIAGTSKLIYVGLLLKLGSPYVDQALMVVIFDAAMGTLLLAFALQQRKAL